MPIEVLDLNTSHSLIRNHKPANLPLEAIDRIQREANKDNFASFGLFDTSSPNYYTYYPEVKPEDLNPSDAEFVEPVFRLLSQIVIAPSMLAIDFTMDGVLKRSMPLLLGQSVFTDHEMITGNALGSISQVFWQDSYLTDGVKVPAGINGTVKIDGKSNPRIARGILMNPPSIHSASVQLQFAWKPSHKFKDEREFYNKLGTFDEKGVRIRKVVEEVLRYAELSLVPHGMDPYAKKLDGGKIVLARQAQKIYSMQMSEETIRSLPNQAFTSGPDQLPYSHISMAFSEVINTSDNNNTNNNDQNQDNMFEELLAALELTTEQFATPEELQAHILAQFSALKEKETEVGTLTEQVNTLTATVTERDEVITTLTEEVTGLRDLATGALVALKEEAKKFYNLVKGDKADPAILTSIDTMAKEAIIAFISEWKTQYENAVPLTCQDCHSTNVSRKASETTGNETPENFMDSIKKKAAKKAAEGFINS